MKILPRASEVMASVGRVVLWSFPLLFAGAHPRHGYQWDLKLLLEAPWVLAAIIGLVRNANRDARIFYGVWLVGLAALEAWRFAVPTLAASWLTSR